ncbi:MAG: hypothetical protein WBZ14_14335 [Terriglobales bacterium]
MAEHAKLGTTYGRNLFQMRRYRILALLVFSAGIASAGTYWVSPTGAATWSGCSGSIPLNGTGACNIRTANSNAVAGDTVYLRGGTYSLSADGVAPTNSGSSPSMRIAFAAYTGETPIFVKSAGYVHGIYLGDNNYISIRGVTFEDMDAWAYITNSSSHNEVANCTFQSSTQGRIFYIGVLSAHPSRWATNNWIHNNHFSVSGAGCTDGGSDIVRIGTAQGSYKNSTDNDNNNTIENNFFEHAPHSNFDNYGLYTVFRNNILHNEPWSSGCTRGQNAATYSSSSPNYTVYNGLYGHRDFQISEDYNRTGTYVLVEGNRSGYASVNQANDGADNFSLAAPQNIVRYNFFYASMNPGILFKYAWGYGLNSGGNGGTYNRVYNNTFYQSGYGYPRAWPIAHGGSCTLSYCPWPQSAISLYVSGSGLGNVLKNNLFYLSAGFTNYGSDVMDKGTPSNGWTQVTTVANNWCTGAQKSKGGCSAYGNPQFTNPDLSNPASTTLPDLSLQSTSGAINGGTYLTTATNSGSGSTTLSVADALYFQDGSWGSDLAKASTGLGGTMQADWISIGTVTNVVQISSVSYGTNNSPAGAITLASPMSWSSGAPIWLYKKSDGAAVLVGAAPDYGASEYGAPQGLEAHQILKK